MIGQYSLLLFEYKGFEGLSDLTKRNIVPDLLVCAFTFIRVY